MASSERHRPSDQTVLREVSAFLRACKNPDNITFKQVRQGVEKSLRLPEGSLRKENKAKIREAVHTVLDRLEKEGAAKRAEEEEGEEEGEEEEAEFETAAVAAAAPPGRGKGEASPAKRAKKRGIRVVAESADGADVPTAKRGSKKKKTKAKSGGGGGKQDEDDGLVCVLNENSSARKQVNVVPWKGNILVNIRLYYRKEEQTFAPSPKGITLNPAQWEALTSATRRIDRAIDELS